jgi:hypothetical protein
MNDQAFRKVQVNYEKQTNKSQKNIKFEVGDLMWLNIKDFKMLKILANRFVPKYMVVYSQTLQVTQGWVLEQNNKRRKRELGTTFNL